MTRLFSETEMTDISAIAKENKFKVGMNDFIYPDTSEQRLKFYLNACRFVENLVNNLGEEKKEIIDKLNTLLKDNYNTIKECLILKNKLNNDVNYGRKKALDKIEKLLNDPKANLLLDCVLEFGRTRKLYNPNENVGY